MEHYKQIHIQPLASASVQNASYWYATDGTTRLAHQW